MILSGKFTKLNGMEITRVLFNTQSPLFPHPPLKGGVL